MLFRMSSSGLAPRTTRSASFPSAIVPDEPARFRYRAASLVAAIVSVAGFLFADYRSEQRVAQIIATKEADQDLYDDALFTALEKHPSGQTIAWTNPDTGTSGNITPVRTFKSKSGLWCREYDSMLTRDEGLESLRAIACREPQGTWKTRAVLYEES